MACVASPENENTALVYPSAVSELPRCGDSPACRHFQSGADVCRDLGRVVINEMADTVMRDATELGPVSQGGNGGLLVFRENPAGAQADDVRELAF